MAEGRWFFRVIELDDGRWACRHGVEEFDSHGEMGDAVAHIRSIAGRTRARGAVRARPRRERAEHRRTRSGL